MGVTTKAEHVWALLKGLLCVYKPAGLTLSTIRGRVIGNICRDLNQMECRPPLRHVYIEGSPEKALSVTVGESFADNPLVVGPRYQAQDVRCSWAARLGKDTSGVLRLNGGTVDVHAYHISRPTRAYHIKGRLGEATDNAYMDGKIVEKAKFGHVKRSTLDRILAGMQAAHQKHMFEQSGLDIQSQAAYELASKGPIRPSSNTIPVVYGLKCIFFNPPDFTIEVQCINEYEAYLKMLIHEIGLQVHSVATCTALQCIRHGHFTLEHALVRKHWSVQHIINNMQQTREIFQQLKHTSARLVNVKDSLMLQG